MACHVLKRIEKGRLRWYIYLLKKSINKVILREQRKTQQYNEGVWCHTFRRDEKNTKKKKCETELELFTISSSLKSVFARARETQQNNELYVTLSENKCGENIKKFAFLRWDQRSNYANIREIQKPQNAKVWRFAFRREAIWRERLCVLQC